MENEYMKRGYLLPEGCKDLADVLNSLTLPEQMNARELAEVLKQPPYRIIGDLFEFGVFATVNQQISFETMAKLVRKYGYEAKRAA